MGVYIPPAAFSMDELVDKEREMGMRLGPWERHALLHQPHVPEKVRRYLMMAQKHPHLVMARQGLTTMDTNDVNTAAFGARNTSASELNILQDGSTGASAATAQAVINQFCAIPANDARAGKVYEVRAAGTYSNTSTPTILWTPRWGTSTTPATNVTLGAQPSAWTTITGTTGLPWYLEFTLAIRTSPPGATQGTAKGIGSIAMGIPVTSSQMSAGLMMGGTAATIDTSGQGAAGCGVTMNITWGTSSASNTLTTEIWILRSLN